MNLFVPLAKASREPARISRFLSSDACDNIPGFYSVFIRLSRQHKIKSDQTMQPAPNVAKPFSLTSPDTRLSGLSGLLLRCFRGPVESTSGLSTLQKIYESMPRGLGAREFAGAALDFLDIKCEATRGSLSTVPKQGPVVVVANHPFGGVEGVILAHLLRQIRPDVKLLANHLLGRIPELRDFFIFVDPFETRDALRKNIQPMREAIEWVKDGGLLVVFPSGTVSHFQVQSREVSDPPWHPSIGRLVRKSRACVVPFFFAGTNGPLFQLLGLVHPLLRTAMLPRELVNRMHTTIEFKVGKPVRFEKLDGFSSDERLVNYLRVRSYLLADQLADPFHGPLRRIMHLVGLRPGTSRALEPIVKEEAKSILSREVAALPKEQILLSTDDNTVYYARADQIPHLLREIGRLRETTFRDVQEGTGRGIDLDRFDNYYLHLFVWNNANEQVVGAYRMGRTDWILRRFGKKGLYTSTLFDYRGSLIEQIGPSLELGRSFVRKEYQKTYSALLLLWRGIGSYVVRNPRYKTLIGAVSINNEYESISRQLMVRFLQENNFVPELAKMIKAKNPLRIRRIRGVSDEMASVVVSDVKEVAELLEEIESTQKNIPVLLRQYLKLGGKLLGFNVDPSFGGVLDGLILIDLTETETKLRERYLGKEGSQQFMTHHISRSSSHSAQ